MTKRGGTHLQKSDDLSSVDTDLEDAMARLDATSQRIDDLLDGNEPGTAVDDSGAASEETEDQAEGEPENSPDA